jgi:hypothetical protein
MKHARTWSMLRLRQAAKDNADWPAVIVAIVVLVLMATRVIE